MRRNVACLLFLILSFSRAIPDENRLLTTESFFEMETISNPLISPDGKTVLFSRQWTDQMEDLSRSNLWLVDQDGRRLRQLTQGNWRDSSPVWSPDGNRIAFISDRSGSSQIHILWMETRETAQLTHLSYTPSELTWSPDGRFLAFTQRLPDERPILPVNLPRAPEGAKRAKKAVIIDRLSWARDGVGPIPKGYSHIFVIDASVGGTARQITSGDYSNSSPQWSGDGETIFFSSNRKGEEGFLVDDSEIYAVQIRTLEVRALTDRKGPDRNPQVSPDGRWIAYAGYDEKGYTSHLSDLYLMDTQGENKRLLAGGLDNSPSGITWSPDGSGVYFLLSEWGVSNLYFAPLNGTLRRVTNGDHVLGGFSLSRSGIAAMTRSTSLRPPCLVSLSLKNPGQFKELVDVNRDVLEGVRLGRVAEKRFSAPDGLPLQGWLVYPAAFEPDKKYPMVLFIHGGPWSMYSVDFNWSWQHFAANGYAVFFMNPRGSTGYGQDFVNGIQYAYPGKDYDDLMAGVDAAISEGFIDEQNLFVCGGSGGGVLTAWIVGHTNRFRAAVSMRPVINWHSFVGTTDGADWYRQFRKYPWEDPMEYALRSPLHYTANVQTPTMVMTGEEDLRTPIGQSEEYYRALKMLGKETLLVRMPEEFHGWRRPSHRLLQQLYLLAWFEKYRIKSE